MKDSVVVVSPALLTNAHTEQLAVTAHFYYTLLDPFAACLTITAEIDDATSAQSTWTFARDLLDTALSGSESDIVGMGNVILRYQPTTNVLCMVLIEEEGDEHTVLVLGDRVIDFIEQTSQLVPLSPVDDIAAAANAFDHWGRKA